MTDQRQKQKKKKRVWGKAWSNTVVKKSEHTGQRRGFLGKAKKQGKKKKNPSQPARRVGSKKKKPSWGR